MTERSSTPQRFRASDNLWLYQALDQIPGFKSRYTAKFFAICFVATHLPLVTLTAYFSLRHTTSSAFWTLGLVLGATLLATGLAFWLLRELLRPVQLARQALQSYLDSNQRLALPTQYHDEMGLLLRDLGTTLDRLAQKQTDSTYASQAPILKTVLDLI